MRRRGVAWAVLPLVAMVCGLMVFVVLPPIGANAVLRPTRRAMNTPTPAGCEDVRFSGEDGVVLAGWRCAAASPARGTLVYLHGIADNRASSLWAIRRFTARGLTVIAYDSRANGDSGGAICTYGFLERRDLHRVIDSVGNGPIMLLGDSLGAAVALQEAADDPRIAAVVAAESFSDLRQVAIERAPWVFTAPSIARAFALIARDGGFSVDDVSPRLAAKQIGAPVLLIHGAADTETRPEHSQRILAQLAGQKRLILVPNAHHSGALTPDVWPEIDRWFDAALAGWTQPN